MRYTIVDGIGTVSFIGGCDNLWALVAACAENPRSFDHLLTAVEKFDRGLWEYVSCGLAIFDEHNVGTHCEAIRAALKFCHPHEQPVFRVLDSETRRASLQPVKAGIVIFNLPARRIVQMQNTHNEIRRRGKVIVRDGGGRPRVYRYELPANWVIVP